MSQMSHTRSTPLLKSLSLSNILAACVVFAGTFYKLPQVLKIYQAKSAKGVSIYMIILDAWTTLVETAYSYANNQPYIDWGEAPPQLFCSTAVALQIFYYERKTKLQVLYTYAAAIALATASVMHAPQLIGKKIGLKLLTFLKTINMLITVFSKLPQIQTNYTNQSTGQLSVSTMSLGCLGSIIRFYTLFQSANGVDPLMVLNQFTSLIMNGTIVGQILYYGSKGSSSRNGDSGSGSSGGSCGGKIEKESRS
jgi:mannose-P-dolichol utilization defect protein 1